MLGALTASLLASSAMAAPPSLASLNSLPLAFEPNRGQESASVLFAARGAAGSVAITPNGAVLRPAGFSAPVHLSFRGATLESLPVAEARLPGVGNYYLGTTQITGVPNYERVRQHGVYPGVDLLYYGKGRTLEYDFIVQPGADPQHIVLRFEGAEGLRTDASGDLLIETRDGTLRQHRPMVYQETAGGRRTVAARYKFESAREVRFDIGDYDRSAPLIIDPVVTFSTFYGDASTENARVVEVDSTGNILIAGSKTQSGAGTDVLVLKLNGNGTQLVYATTISGTGDESASTLAVGSDGSVYVGGGTKSSNFPVLNAAQPVYGGAADGFVAKLNGAGQVVYATYVGGGAFDGVRGIAVDSAGSAYVAGDTSSLNFPTSNAYQATLRGDTDGFLVKLTPSGNARLFATYFGGTGTDLIADVKLDASGNIVVTGSTSSTNLPLQNPIVASVQSGVYAFLTKFNSAASALVHSTFLAGTGTDEGTALALDGTGAMYVAGNTGADAFVTKINPAGSAVVYGRTFGGSKADVAWDVAVDGGGNAYVVGATISTDFPTVQPLQAAIGATNGSADGFVARLNAAGTLSFSTYLGGTLNDLAASVAVGPTGGVYVVGDTNSTNFPVSAAYQGTFGGATDLFVLRLTDCWLRVAPLTTSFAAPGGSATATITEEAGCGWSASVDVPWIALSTPSSGTGSGSFTYTLQANTGAARTGTLTIGAQQFTISQAAAVAPGCTFTFNPGSLSTDANGKQSGSFTVTASAPTCSWNASSNREWAQIYPLAGTGSATMAYTIFPNFATTARSGAFTVGGSNLNYTQAGNSGSADERFVGKVYFNFFGRIASPDEVQFQINSGLRAGMTRGQMVTNFFNSLEFNMGGRFVAGAYVGLLDRNPEYGGWLFQRNAMAYGGLSVQSLITNFLESAEYKLKFGNPSNEEFVRLLYRYILLREAADSEVTFQAKFLNDGTMQRRDMAIAFLNSGEFRDGTGPRLTTFLLYATLLQRDASSAEAQPVQASIAGGKPIATIIAEFVASAEFTNSLL